MSPAAAAPPAPAAGATEEGRPRSVDFTGALERLGAWLDAAHAEWAVVGGLALAAHGAGRLTLDLDIATECRVQEDLVRYLESLGYATVHRSTGYSNHVHAEPEKGRIDVVYVDGPTAARLFGQAEPVELFPGVQTRIPRPAHLVAMKLLAAKNDPRRRLQELADIVALLRATELEPEIVRVYFERYGLLDAWEEIRTSLRPPDPGGGPPDGAG